MPLYFAYGSNMDVDAMASRCPRSKALGAARLMRHRFVIMGEGYANVVRDPRAMVHGVLWDIALSDMRALDAYESVSSGLYTKIQQAVFLARNADGVRKSARALVYVGRNGATGAARPGYMDGVIAAATSWALPETYIRELEGWRGSPARRFADPSTQKVETGRAMRATRAADRDSSGNIIVKPRFGSPMDGNRE